MRILLLIIPLLILHAEEGAVPLPTAATAALERLARTEEKLSVEHRQAVIAERTRTIDVLAKVLKDTMKAGDLDAANAVKAQIDILRQRNADDTPTDLLGNPTAGADPAKLIVGEWTFTKTNGVSGSLVASAGGGATAKVGPFAIDGRWELVKEGATRARRIRFTWMADQNRWEEITSIDAEKASGDSSDAGAGGITLRRKK